MTVDARPGGALAERRSAAPAGALSVTLSPLGSPAEIEAEWTELASAASPTFFLSWLWIRTWLTTYAPSADVLRIDHAGELVGLALVVRSTSRRHCGLLQTRTLHLHQTGRECEDQIWIEYNGILCRPGFREAVYSAATRFLVDAVPGWDEMVIGATTVEEARLLTEASALHRHELWSAPCHGIDLAAIATDGRSYLDTLSRNTRHQIRRTRRVYEETGRIELVRATDVDEAVASFDALGPLHRERWGEGAGGSGYANPEFVRFHHALIRGGFDVGAIDVLHLRLDGRLLGGYYNFLHDGTVYFYLAGMRAESDARLKPGLLGHALCVEHYVARGMRNYDFMGGADRYKRSLGAVREGLVKISLQRARPLLVLERIGRRVKHELVG